MAELLIGRYRLLEPIGHGGMATVHLAQQLGAAGFSRHVAVKRLHPQYATDPHFVSMFLDEARLASRIRDVHVVEVLDVLEIGTEILMVMPLIDGVTLTTLLRNVTAARRRMPLPIASAIVVGLLRGLHAAHTATGPDGAPLEIIHRDVSPQNVLVGVDGVTRVLDFGVAKANGQLHATRAGEVRGKPAYMAPEHLRSGATIRSDLYSAAVVLWEAITCDRLFVSESEAGLLTQVLEGRVRSPREVAPEIPPALDALVMRSLSYDPRGRPPSAERMAQELAAIVPPSPLSDVGRFVSRFGGEQLERLSQAMRAVDRGLTPPAVVAPSTPPSPPMPQRMLSDMPAGSALRRGAGEVTQTGPTAGPALPPPRRRPLWLPALSAMTVLGVAGGATLAWRVGSPLPAPAPSSESAGLVLDEAREADSEVSSAAEPMVLPSSRESADREAAPAEPAASASSQPSALPSSSGAAPPPRTTAQPPTPTKTAEPTSAPAEPQPAKSKDCDPPYELDQNGVRRVKTRCFKVVP
jgi:eukaryotic-like serine/threonine-protein kinase